MRLLRLKYEITLPELAVTVGVSPQYLSSLELGEYYITENAVSIVQLAFARAIETRRNHDDAILAAYLDYREQILDFVEVDDGY
jgi:transcriptional regulator with XRE-family HTH domain